MRGGANDWLRPEDSKIAVVLFLVAFLDYWRVRIQETVLRQVAVYCGRTSAHFRLPIPVPQRLPRGTKQQRQKLQEARMGVRFRFII